MNSGIVIPQKLLFYCRYIDDIYNRRKKSKHDELFQKLNNYHPKINVTIEVSPTKLFDTGLHLNSGIYDFEMYRKTTKQSAYWSSKIPKIYKRNVTLEDLYWSNRISSNYSEEIKFISYKYEKADYPKHFINSSIRQFEGRLNQREIDDFDDYIIPQDSLDTPKPFFLIEFTIWE